MRPKAKSPLPCWPACASVASRVGSAYAPRAKCAPARAPQQCRKHEKGDTGQKTRCASSLRNGCHAAHATCVPSKTLPEFLEETIKLAAPGGMHRGQTTNEATASARPRAPPTSARLPALKHAAHRCRGQQAARGCFGARGMIVSGDKEERADARGQLRSGAERSHQQMLDRCSTCGKC